MIEFLLSAFHLCIENTDTFFCNIGIYVFAVTAVIGENILVVFVDADVIHIVAFGAEFHFWSILFDKIYISLQ
jgi:hypothetical protein